MSEHVPDDFYISVVSSHEQLLGAHKFIAGTSSLSKIVRGYELIEAAMSDYGRFQRLSFDRTAAEQFLDLRSQKIRIGTMDLRIASITLTHNFTLLTRNTVDFTKVPGLRVEDWTTW